MIKILITLIIVILSTTINADNKKLPIPRFVSIKSNEVNARSGPTTKSAVEWVFVKKRRTGRNNCRVQAMATST